MIKQLLAIAILSTSNFSYDTNRADYRNIQIAETSNMYRTFNPSYTDSVNTMQNGYINTEEMEIEQQIYQKTSFQLNTTSSPWTPNRATYEQNCEDFGYTYSLNGYLYPNLSYNYTNDIFLLCDSRDPTNALTQDFNNIYAYKITNKGIATNTTITIPVKYYFESFTTNLENSYIQIQWIQTKNPTFYDTFNLEWEHDYDRVIMNAGRSIVQSDWNKGLYGNDYIYTEDRIYPKTSQQIDDDYYLLTYRSEQQVGNNIAMWKDIKKDIYLEKNQTTYVFMNIKLKSVSTETHIVWDEISNLSPYSQIYQHGNSEYGFIDTYNITTIETYWQKYINPNDTNIVDIPGVMMDVLTMPFTFISGAFNLTLFPGTPYAVNFSNLFLSVIGVAVFILLMRLLIKLWR